MKKLGFISLLCMMILFMMACGSKGKEEEVKTTPAVAGVEEDKTLEDEKSASDIKKEDVNEEIAKNEETKEELETEEAKTETKQEEAKEETKTETKQEEVKEETKTETKQEEAKEETKTETNKKETKKEDKTEEAKSEVKKEADNKDEAKNKAEKDEEKKDEKKMDDKKLIALTFDDGPNTAITPKILDILEDNDAVATFFLIGMYINESTIKIMERQLELGCEIANHTWSHSNLTTLSAEKIQEEIQKTSDKIYESVGVTPAFFRPPFIAVNELVYQNIELPFINGINCNDWTGSVTAQERIDKILKDAKDGDIVLLHDFVGNNNTVAALEGIILGLREKGFEFVTVSQLFELKGVDPNVSNKIWTNTGW